MCIHMSINCTIHNERRCTGIHVIAWCIYQYRIQAYHVSASTIPETLKK